MSRQGCRLISIALLGLAAALSFSIPARARTCEDLTSLKLPNATVTSAEMVDAGQPAATRGPGADGDMQGPFTGGAKGAKLPAYCRVQITAQPTIRIEVWMPAAGWNGEFEAVGNGGKAGEFSYPAMATALRAGYATSSTDTGHQGKGSDTAWAFRQPGLIADFAYRAVHEMTVISKAVISAYYGKPQRFSFFNGCSTGGRQGLTEAQRYPDDYNGILSGDPVINYTHLQAAHLSIALRTRKVPGSYFPPDRLPAMQKASLAACDAIDGVKDGLIEDPLKCNFRNDPSALLRKGGATPSCLTAPQLQTVKDIYAGYHDPRGNVAYGGFMPGHETGWNMFLLDGADPSKPFTDKSAVGAVGFFKNFVFDDPNWNFLDWNYDKDMTFADQKIAAEINATNPDLKRFRAHGGKLLLYHGWTDPGASPLETLDYYEDVVASIHGVKAEAPGEETPAFIGHIESTQHFARLFMVPGMDHCGGGPGPNVFDAFGSLAIWVEQGRAPERIVAAHMDNGSATMTRPLCPYPKTAHYTGHGSTDEAANFVCSLPSK
ncbi:MAG: tannase/feruloyl esterase family alpha/beta hydrolase [Acidobacteriota bacterium]|nr:tannase/feruloyl esterase family alpha/beta hydrolase [Acidobacteriota bacterium]